MLWTHPMRLKDQVKEALDQCGPLSISELSTELQRRANMPQPPVMMSDYVFDIDEMGTDGAAQKYREEVKRMLAHSARIADAGYSIVGLYKLIKTSGDFSAVECREVKAGKKFTVVRWEVKE